MWPAFFDRFSLRAVLIFNVIVPLLCALFAATYLGLFVMEHLVEKRMQEDVQLVARAIRLPVSYSLEKERFGSMSQALQSVFRIGRVYGAYVYDEQGRRVAAVGAVEPEQKQDDLQKVVEGGEHKGQYEKIEGHRVYSYFVPLFDSTGKSSGLIQVTRKKSDFENYISWLRIRATAILGGVSLIISIFVLYGFHTTVGRYLQRLAQSMAQVQKGDRSHRALPTGPKEIATLARALNDMLDSMDRSEREIAERRETQQRLETKLQQSEKMAAIGQLAAGVAHELGAPLSLIDGKAQRSLRDDGIDTAHAACLQDIRKQVQRMSDIVRQLLDFGKGAMGHKRWSRVDQVAGSAITTVKKELGQGVEVTTQGPEPGPFLYVDPLRFEQVLINLLRNACQTGSTTKVVLSWEEAEQSQVVLTIEDDGPGISDEIKPRIFEPFFSQGKSSENTGMGLSVVYGIIQEHEGSIHVYDAELGGTGFSVVLSQQSCKGQADKGDGDV